MINLKDYLLKALEAAQARRGYCAPNPAVGAVVVSDDRVVAIGTHWAAGHPHAEVDALHKAGDAARGATLYVSLEPCCHHGKTPPCTDAIIAAGIQRVVFGFVDPNPLASYGQQVLIDAGIECEQFSVLEINAFYCSYAYWLENKRPWVTLKLAMSRDLKIAAESGKPVKITGDACDAITQEGRHHSDAILTTMQTILNDDPRMNARLTNKTVAKSLFILDSQLRLDCSSQIFKTAKHITVYHRDNLTPREDLDCVAVPFDEKGLDLSAVLSDLGRRGLHDVWVEVGARAFHSFYQNKLANEILFYRSAKFLGENGLPAFLDSNPLEEQTLSWQSLSEDEVARLTIE